ncbi:MAG: MOSC domain-containing protein [Nostocaceae cyanobacterium]|nr:MOSC domain-containing protein [Nostocaceae cyanobacterium]
MDEISVQQLFKYPFKGLSAQKCDRVDLQVNRGIPGDRAFALMYKQGEIDTDSQSIPWLKKEHFAMQNDWSGLAGLDCNYDADTGTLRVQRQDVELLVADTKTTRGRDLISAFFTGYLAGIDPSPSAKRKRTALILVGDGEQTRYPDREAVHISLVSQATINHLSQITGQNIDVRRFRPNIVIKGVEPWSEFDWVGQEMQLGTARIEITAPIGRCLNIDVNPETGKRDINLLSVLKKQFQHTQTGVVAKVISDGRVVIGDSIIK